MDTRRHQPAPGGDNGSQDEGREATPPAPAADFGPQHSTQGSASNAAAIGGGGEDEVTSSILDCPVCLQPSVYPVELPCGHIFCFLCIKGVATQGGQQARCAICRAHIPTYVLTNPTLKDISQLYKDDKTCSGFKWFYESRSGGWWQYEERTMQELEKAFEAKQPSCQLLIAGHMYDIDFTQMIQFRVGNRNLFRRIKRDTSTADKRGIAGIRLVPGGAPVPIEAQAAQQPPQQVSQSRSRRSPRGTASSYSGSSARTAGVNMAAMSTGSSNALPASASPNDFVTSPVSSQQSFEDSEEDSDVFVDSDDDEEDDDENDDDMDLGEEEEDSETDEYNPEEEELRDGARAPTSRSDRSTSSFNNQTPPPLSSSAATAAGGASSSSSSRARASKCGNRSTPPTTGSRSTPSSSSSTSNNSDHVNTSPSPVSPTLRASPNVRSPLPSIVTTSNPNHSSISTSIQIGPGIRITVDYTNPTGEEEIL